MAHHRDERKRCKRLGLGLLIVLSCFGVAAFAMTLAFQKQQNDALQALAREASFNNSQSQLQIGELQTQVVELSMAQGNETLLYNGTFNWAISRSSAGFTPNPFDECIYGSTASSLIIVNQGSGYRVGDLITPETSGANPLAAQFYMQPVLRVTQVDGLGAVLAFDTLHTGCLSPGVTTDTYQTICVVGTGVTVQISGGAVPLPSTYYDYPSPPRVLASPLHVARYEVRSLQLESATWTILYLFPPEAPMAIYAPPPFTTINHIRISAYETYFNVPELVASTSYDNGIQVTGLTQHNYEALNFTDSTNCVVSSTCVEDAVGQLYLYYPHAIQLLTRVQSAFPFTVARSESFISFSYVSLDPLQDFAVNGATFTLNRPLMLVLNIL